MWPFKTKLPVKPAYDAQDGSTITLKPASDPFREVVEYADRERTRMLVQDGWNSLSEYDKGVAMGYTRIVRVAMEAAGIFPRYFLDGKESNEGN